MRKVTSDKLTVGMLSSNFKEKVKDFIASNQGFTFMNGFKGIPAKSLPSNMPGNMKHSVLSK